MNYLLYFCGFKRGRIIFLTLNFILIIKILYISDKTKLVTITRRSERRRLQREKQLLKTPQGVFPEGG